MSENIDAERRKDLKVNGWKFSVVKEFLGLAVEELEYVEIKINLGKMVREFRERKGLSKAKAADILKLSRSRLTKIETADPTVSIDLQIKSLLALGATKQEIGQKIAC
jgi:DNA-binding XRE family transcriptional regulator